jgi:hypothetical protein
MARKQDVDIIYDYIVEGDSQQSIADTYGLNQKEVSNRLTKDYGFNKGNVAWGTGANNDKGRYSNATREDIEDFIDSGSDDFESWYNNRYDNDGYDDYEDSDYDEDNDYDYGDSINDKVVRDRPVRQIRTSNGLLSGLFNSRFAGTIFLVLLVIGLSILAELKEIVGAFPSYLELLWNGNYVYLMVFPAVIYSLIKILLGRYRLSDIVTEPPVYSYLGLGLIGAGLKLLFDMSFEMLWPGLIPIVLGVGLIVILYKIDN